MTLSVLIADDHALLRQGLSLLLAAEYPGCRCEHADSLDGALSHLARGRFDLLLIDLGMPGMDGAESLRALREAHPDTRLAVVTGQDDRSTILQCLTAGVHGYLLKASPTEETMRAIATVLSGNLYVAPALAQLDTRARAAQEMRPVPAPPGCGDTPRFTPRQRDVLRLLRDGLSTKEIARRLELGPGTIKIHLAAIFRALNAQNRTEAASLASRLDL